MKRFMVFVCVGLGLGLALTLLGALDSTSGARLVAQAQGVRYYRVAPSCTGIPDCYTTVQEAVEVAQDGDVIQVAAGTYTDLHLDPQRTITQVVYVRRSVTIRGGYTSANWQVPDSLAHPTVLDARGQGRVLYVASNVSPTIEGLVITGGDATGLGGGPLGEEDVGGGVYVAGGSTVVIHDNRVFGNTAGQYGGGLYLGDAVATLSGNTITSNTAYQGGGLYLLGGVATLNGNTIVANSADYGGGLFLSSSAAVINRNTIRANSAITAGGGLLLLHSNDAMLNGNAVTSNTARHGGGLYLEESAATLANNVLAGNRADLAGSGLYIGGSSPLLLHTTVARNSGGDGSGIYVTSGVSGSEAYTAVVAMVNTILVSHTVGIVVTAGNTATLEATLWGQGAWANRADSGGAGTVVTGTRNYRGDPDFVAPGAGNYHIGIVSAALDKGVNVGIRDDMDGEPRPQGSRYDIGADETGLALTKRASPPFVQPGARIQYTIRVTNTSVVTLTTSITDVLPGHVVPAGVLTWSPMVLPPGAVQVRTFFVTVEKGYTGVLTNVVEATTDKGAGGSYTEVTAVGYRVYLPQVLRKS